MLHDVSSGQRISHNHPSGATHANGQIPAGGSAKKSKTALISPSLSGERVQRLRKPSDRASELVVGDAWLAEPAWGLNLDLRLGELRVGTLMDQRERFKSHPIGICCALALRLSLGSAFAQTTLAAVVARMRIVSRRTDFILALDRVHMPISLQRVTAPEQSLRLRTLALPGRAE